MSKKASNTFQPDPEQMALMPEVSGNTINGLGENTHRRPSRIYWHNPPDAIAHGKIQQWMVERFNRVPIYKEVYAKGDRGPRELDPLARRQVQDSAENWSLRVTEFGRLHEADQVGIARLDPNWFYTDSEPPDQPWIIVLGVQMDQARLARAPSTDENTDSAHEVSIQYNRGARAATHLANWIRQKGFNAQHHAGPWAGPMTLTPAALACGFGELGKHGNIINRRFGSSFRLSAVVTELPLLATEATEFGADDFCTRCQVCINACPPGAISDSRQTVRGVDKWYVDFDRCIPYFNQTHGCGICIAVCPWSRPGAAPRLAEKMLRRRQRLGSESSARDKKNGVKTEQP